MFAVAHEVPKLKSVLKKGNIIHSTYKKTKRFYSISLMCSKK